MYPKPISARQSIDADQVRAAASRVLTVEGNAVLQMAEALPSDFIASVETILDCKGRVILSGIGKSGHIARKIAATFASTGTPAQFVHPSEASHGDLGMVTNDDVCILISNSGETTELGDIISHTRRFAIPMIAISRKADSTLMRAADLRLLLPDAPEACSIGMAPTTSTTLTLALGDALAVALMQQRGFVHEHFRIFHPGGKLGSKLAQVHQLMHSVDEIPIVPADAPMSETLITMTRAGFGIACVIDDEGGLAGVISDGDIRRNIDGLLEKSAGDVATRSPQTAPPDMLAAEAMAIMNARKVNALVVLDESKRPVGLLRLHECLRAGIA
ncbi:KpsF/GutQ family sugar-phosphate isomerase [Rhodobacter sp. NTK016B]|uniref:KpsF/GutQ family sugar-phosphate isomerase n=1 Tax=Rhodobacter sp. NTK016B TaxID=2759676 RepID=UPI001A8FC444|nr:KpsF/GutQ family sugar-phosphate isomerase [Rhodobacter sp. NTK016B]MBN8291129.1 KpsF/GutQ family sugar-phosphate isomerase [Rhodobacter sp. NTK016B]